MSGILLAYVGGSYSSAPANTVAPVVSGTATVGQSLSCTTGTWTGVPTPTYTYQWFRSPSTSISGATSNSYTLVVADVGNTIFCRVTATNTVGATNADSNTTSTVSATVPDAPTIGTATATGATSATVAYTAPSSNGGSTITSYTATSSPGGVTGTISQSGSGTITVNGLTGGTSYTFTVTATNAIGTSSPSSSSNSITTSLQIGQAYGGGYYGGQINISGTVYNLIVANVSTGQTLGQVWGPYGVTTGVTSVINGSSNSATLSGLGSSYQAARFCENLNTGGYTDWYLPAKNELEVLYYFLKPTIGTNSGYNNSGSNANAVSPEPVSTPYDSTSYPAQGPAQTSATNFRSGASSQEFNSSGNPLYWTSTEQSDGNAYTQSFTTGRQDISSKDDTNIQTRAIRKVVA